MLLSIAMLPLLAIGLWAVEKKIQRDLTASDLVGDTQADADFSVDSAAQGSE